MKRSRSAVRDQFAAEAEETAAHERTIQSRIDGKPKSGGNGEHKKPMQAGAREYPGPPLPGQHVAKPGTEAVLDLKPMAEWGAIAEQDIDLLHFTDTPQDAFDHLRDHLIAHHLEPPSAQEAAAPGIAKTRG